MAQNQHSELSIHDRNGHIRTRDSFGGDPLPIDSCGHRDRPLPVRADIRGAASERRMLVGTSPRPTPSNPLR
ncbi:DUF2188 domain-containing protein [Sphingomonas aestuarii]